MAKRGPKPAPPEVMRAKGSYRKDPQRENKSAPSANGDAPKMPADLDDLAREKWAQIVDDLRSIGVLSSECGEILTAYCVAYSEWRKARDIINTEGMTIPNGSGSDKRHPNLCDLHKYRDQMNRILPELGLTPSSRGRLVSTKPSDGDRGDIADLMDRLGGCFTN